MKKQFFNAFYLTALLILINGCGNNEGDPVPADCALEPIVFTVSLTDENCGISDGVIEVSASGGQGNLSYSNDGGDTFQASPIFNNLKSGNYSIVVQDSKKCESTSDVSLQNTGGLAISITSQSDAGCETSAGEVVVTATGGSGNIQFKIDNGSLQASGTFGGLAVGTYTIHAVEDGTGCETTKDVTLLSGVSYASSISNIITTECATSGCHVGGTGREDFTSFSNIQSNASSIKSRTQSGSMPKGGTLTAEQINLIACWVDYGAKDN